MHIVRKPGGIIEIEGRVRIEAGPVRRNAVATAELLSDEVTASHYQVGKPDAFGKPIKLGEKMDYIDWKAPERVFYVYELAEVARGAVDPLTGEPAAVGLTRWMPKGDRPSEAEALTLATDLAAGKSQEA